MSVNNYEQINRQLREDSVRREAELNLPQTIQYLNYAFGEAMKKFRRAVGASRSPYKLVKGVVRTEDPNAAYEAEVEFAHLINEIQRGPRYTVTSLVSTANAMIVDLTKQAEAS